MAVVDSQYKFLYVDVGCNGRQSDGGVFNRCSFGIAMDNKQLNFPSPQPLPGRSKATPFVLTGWTKVKMVDLTEFPMYLLKELSEIYQLQIQDGSRHSNS